MKLKEAKTLEKIGELKGWVDTSQSVINSSKHPAGISEDYAFELLTSKLNKIEELAEEISKLTADLK
jgi:hypothetical protein